MTIGSSPLSILPDLSVITLQKQKALQFLTSDLHSWNISYKWGFPFKLLFTFQTKAYVIRSLSEAQRVHKLLKTQTVAESQFVET